MLLQGLITFALFYPERLPRGVPCAATHLLTSQQLPHSLPKQPGCTPERDRLASHSARRTAQIPLHCQLREELGNIQGWKCVDSGGSTKSGKGCLMKRVAKALRVGLSLLGLAVFGSVVGAQDVPPLDKIQSQAELDKAITTLDAGLFDAYNKCDLEKFSSYFTENVEFYHDQGGLTLGRAALTESVKKNICGKVTRELVPGTLQVFYMKGYGAIEMGVHRFHHPEHEETEGVGEGRFVHLWQ